LAKIHPLFPPSAGDAGPAGRGDAQARPTREQLLAALDRIPRARRAPAPGAAVSPPRSAAPETRRAAPASQAAGPADARRAAPGLRAPAPGEAAELLAALDRIVRTAQDKSVAPEPARAAAPRAAAAPEPPRRKADLVPLLRALSQRPPPPAPRPTREDIPHRPAAQRPREAAPYDPAPSGPALRREPPAGVRTPASADAGQRAAIEDLLAVLAEQNRAAQDRLLQAEVMLNRAERLAQPDGGPRPAGPSGARRLVRTVLDLNVTLGVLLICSLWLGPLAALRIVGYGLWGLGGYLVLVAAALAWCGGVDDLVDRAARALDHPRLAWLARLLPASAGRSPGRAAADALLDFTLWAGAAEGVFLAWFLIAR
jgi:hypothetical protein